MDKERIEILELEVDDIVYVNKEHGYCAVKDIGYSINGSVTIEFQHTDKSLGDRLFTKNYSSKKTFEIFQ
jgi:hypothetical protein